jgi:hypothetical protein
MRQNTFLLNAEGLVSVHLRSQHKMEAICYPSSCSECWARFRLGERCNKVKYSVIYSTGIHPSKCCEAPTPDLQYNLDHPSIRPTLEDTPAPTYPTEDLLPSIWPRAGINSLSLHSVNKPTGGNHKKSFFFPKLFIHGLSERARGRETEI